MGKRVGIWTRVDRYMDKRVDRYMHKGRPVYGQGLTGIWTRVDRYMGKDRQVYGQG